MWLVGTPLSVASGLLALRGADPGTSRTVGRGVVLPFRVGLRAMCLTMPARVLAVDTDFALVEGGGRRRRASTLLTPHLKPGEWVVIGSGAVLRRITAAQAKDMAEAYELGHREELPR
jgi:hydrogenase assembly chaperone HypC/HupF